MNVVDSFVYIGPTLDHESSIAMDLFDKEWGDCSLFKAGGIVDLD
jgi:hypothetical protein